MNNHRLLELAHKGYIFLFHPSVLAGKEGREDDPDKVGSMISQYITSGKPFMVTRLGSGELDIVAPYYCRINHIQSPWKYIKGEQSSWWWTRRAVIAICRNAGFFNPTEQSLTDFSKLMINDMKQVDILGSWPRNELLFSELKQAKRVKLKNLEPFWAKEPWTKHLKGKRVLIVHPFAKTIESQYAKREHLFANPDILPPFASLRIVKAVQSLGNNSNGFNTWLDALKYMEDEMDKADYDIAIIGCGAYGMPLAAHAKRTGHQAIHLGGPVQLLFGIKGNRWFDPSDTAHYKDYSPLANDYWVRPSNEERPTSASAVENACYW